MAIKSRIFFVMQYEYHPETGELLLSEDMIKKALAHRSIKRYAYVYHDKDVYSEADEEADPNHKAGTLKPPHWHIVIEMGTRQVEVDVIAKWFGIPMNFVNVAKGVGAFMDCVQYLTHEDVKQQTLGKYLYPDEEIIANFDFRDCLVQRAERKAKYGRDLNDKEALRNEVLFRGMTLREAADKYPLLYQQDFSYLDRCRLIYLSKIAPMPEMRMNYYIEGKGGVGKGLISKALARALVDRDGTMADDEIFFEVGANKATFEGYDGQPVLIWNDYRAGTLLHQLHGRENVFNVFDPFPPNIKQNVKYGSVRLTNRINIVNSVQPWSDFLDGLAGEYKDKYGYKQTAEDKAQSYRRFPFFIVVHEDDYVLGMNKGLFDGTTEYEQYRLYGGLRAGMKRIADRCGENHVLYNAITKQAISPVIEKHDEMSERLLHSQRGTDEEIWEEFRDVGTQDVRKMSSYPLLFKEEGSSGTFGYTEYLEDKKL